ncbi:extracellular solute-binding protein [Nitriliruptor alkaliphilus]|uniref:extracellular solute-binding protein n=1 Tax=Nitriliruptor alkaliphilus TaxID=427918 RepID=UPI001B80CADA|nr:extracellular solute-binding protein [Nitriliruptor alkaliphilus]
MAAALALSACGRSGEADSAPAEASTIGEGQLAGTITVWAQADQGAALPAFAEEFEAEHPDVTINVTAVPWDAAHNKYQTAIAGNSTPDMAHIGTTWMGDFADAFAPVPADFDTSDFFDGSLGSNEVDGTMVGVPWYVDTRVIYYRADLAEDAGYPTFPTDRDDFKAMAEAMQTEAGATWGINLPVAGADSFQSMLPFLWSAGAELTNEDQTQWTLDSDEMVDGLTYYQSLFTDGIATATPDTGAGAAEAAFVNGSVPMFVAGPSAIGSLSAAGGSEFEELIGVGRIPAGTSSTSFVGGGNLVVFENSENQDVAWRFIQWLSQPEVQVRWQQAVGDLPSAQSAWTEPALADDPKLSVFGAQLEDINSPPAVPTWTQVSAAADTVLEQVIRAGLSPAEAMKSLQATADSIGTGA